MKNKKDYTKCQNLSESILCQKRRKYKLYNNSSLIWIKSNTTFSQFLSLSILPKGKEFLSHNSKNIEKKKERKKERSGKKYKGLQASQWVLVTKELSHLQKWVKQNKTEEWGDLFLCTKNDRSPQMDYMSSSLDANLKCILPALITTHKCVSELLHWGLMH